MCDTMVALSDCTIDGSVLFAKNSDREPNEPHIIVRVPRHKLQAGDRIKCTYISVENDKQKELVTNAAILFKPSWIWGAEMGVNEKGVVIGNEAVFTKEKNGAEALLGMDMLRLALEMCSNAREALDYITLLLEKYGQGGKAGYTQNLKYHNSFIIADFNEAYVLETAEKNWAYSRISDIYSISNALTIRNDYEGCSGGLIDNAVAKGWCSSSGEFNFKSCYESRLHLNFTKGDVRQKMTESYLREHKGSLSIADIKAILRSHGGKEEVEGFRNGSMECVCMHAGGGLITSQTTGSFIVQLKSGKIDIWATGSSIPCISVYKPIWFTDIEDRFFTEENSEELVEHWRDLELFHRHILGSGIRGLEEYKQERDLLEQELSRLADEADTDEKRLETTYNSIDKEKQLIDDIFRHQDGKFNTKIKAKQGGLYYRLYWNLQNRKLYD